MIKPRKELKVALDPMVVCKAMFPVGTFVVPPGWKDEDPVEIESHQMRPSKEPEYLWSGDSTYILCSWGIMHAVLYERGPGYARIHQKTPVEVLEKININFKSLKHKYK